MSAAGGGNLGGERPSKPLPPKEVHVWFAESVAGAGAGSSSAEAARMLGPAERERLAAFRFPEQRQAYLASRVLLRTTLSRYAPVEPERWRFGRGQYGRPEIAAPEEGRPLRFSLSRSGGVAAVAVTLHRAVGVDVEAVRQIEEMDGIVDRHFAPGEARCLRALPPDSRPPRFIELWTLKEAYLKARGTGLGQGMDGTEFDIDAEGRVSVRFTPPLEDDPAGWHFELLRPTERVRLAVAIGPGEAAEVKVFRA